MNVLGVLILFLVLLGFLVLVARSVTTLLHELGHALPALLLTGSTVTVYIGSYGDPKSMHLKLGKLELYFEYNPLLWMGGICKVSATEISYGQEMLYILTGPITSFVVAVTACYFTFAYELHALLKLFLIVFLGSSILDLIINLVPRKTPIRLYDGSLTYNDGYQLKMLFMYRRVDPKYRGATRLYQEERYTEAVVIFNELISEGIDQMYVYYYAVNCYLLLKNYEKARDLLLSMEASAPLNEYELTNLGYAYLMLGSHKESIECYEKILQQDPEHIHALHNIGYSLSMLNRFEEAMPFLEKTIKMDDSNAYGYNNRGLARIKLGQTEEGLKDIYLSMELDPANAYTHKNLGIYHFDRQEYAEALQFFMEAKEMDADTYQIDKHINETNRFINTTTPTPSI